MTATTTQIKKAPRSKKPPQKTRSITRGMVTDSKSPCSLQVVEIALRQANGFADEAAALLTKSLKQNITEQAIRKMIKKYPILTQVRFEAQEELLDIAHDNMSRGIRRGDPKYTIYFLSQVAKYRREVDMDFHPNNVFYGRAGQGATASKVLEKVDYSVYSDDELGQLRLLAKKAEADVEDVEYEELD